VVDDVTGLATYKSGEVNGNGLLDINEIWGSPPLGGTGEPQPVRNMGTDTGYYDRVPLHLFQRPLRGSLS
jgi:hypothetical protein